MIFTTSVKCAARESNGNSFETLSSYTQPEYVWANLLSLNFHQIVIHPSLFLYFMTIKLEGMFKLRIGWSFSFLKMIMSGSICPSAVAIQPSNVCFHFLKNKTHTLSHLSSQYILKGPCQKTLVFHPCYWQVKRDTSQFL